MDLQLFPQTMWKKEGSYIFPELVQKRESTLLAIPVSHIQSNAFTQNEDLHVSHKKEKKNLLD